MGYLAFVSYARVNVDFTNPDARLLRFLADIRREIVQRPAILGGDEPLFFDQTNIETGRDWNNELSIAAATSRVVLAIYSPAYFTREYCGREFQVFLDRQAKADPAHPGCIIPVLWQFDTVPSVAAHLQWRDAALPANYEKDGLETILRLSTPANCANYERAVMAIAQRILDAARHNLPELDGLDLKTYSPAFPEKKVSAGNGSTGATGVTLPRQKKARFVFLADQGWDWAPFGVEESIGVIATRVALQLQWRYDDMSIGSLKDDLDQTEETGVPTLLIPDPSGIGRPPIETAMMEYDKARLYENCGLIIPWNNQTPRNDPRWAEVMKVCKRKIKNAIPNHDWTGAVSKELFSSKAIAILTELGGKRMNKRLASNEEFARAEDETGVQAARAKWPQRK